MVLIATLVACNGGNLSKDSLSKLLKENPEILADAIKANPSKILDAFKDAAQKAQEEARVKSEEDEKQKLEQSYENPLVTEIREDDIIRGTKGAPITLVEYSDFQCYYCSKAFENVVSLLDKYKGKIQFVYKHLPVIGQYSELSSKYYEAIRIQDHKKAIKFHDELMKNQAKIRSGGEKFLKEIASKAGADMKKVAKDLDSEAVQKRIDEDKAEAQKYGFQGTPGFILNGVPVRGAYPVEHFVSIVEELKKRGKLKI
jgi:protein-disulfide isomerase